MAILITGSTKSKLDNLLGEFGFASCLVTRTDGKLLIDSEITEAMRQLGCIKKLLNSFNREGIHYEIISMAAALRFRNIEINTAAEESEFLVHTACKSLGSSESTYAFKDGSVLVVNPWEVLFNN
tara:strand:+ start:279 stop:653 length:375 start_codon:yes stop_codon:yes gene_type:complete